MPDSPDKLVAKETRSDDTPWRLVYDELRDYVLTWTKHPELDPKASSRLARFVITHRAEIVRLLLPGVIEEEVQRRLEVRDASTVE